MSRANYYRLKAAACAKIADDGKVAWDIRAQYRELERAWLECAIETQAIDEQITKKHSG
jgi:hypothetical protein